MAEAIMFPDVEEVVRAYLATELAARSDTASVHIDVPTTRPKRFVRVIRTGGQRTLVVDNATLAIECWADDSSAAERLAALVRALVHAMRGTTISGATVYDVAEFGGPANLPDPTSDQARYTMTESVGVRGVAI